MKLQTARLLREVSYEAGVELEIRGSYSGRGMYGKTTTAVVGANFRELIQLVALAGVRIGESDGDNEELPTADEFVADCNFSTDNMGHDIVVY